MAEQHTFAEQGRAPPPQNVDDPMRVFDNEKVEVYDQTDYSFESITEEPTPAQSSAHRGLSARHIQMISLGGCIG
jgi:amino acid permease